MNSYQDIISYTQKYVEFEGGPVILYQVAEGGNRTVAVLQFTPRPEDDGAMMVCQAENSELGEQPIQDSKLLSVNCECTIL